MKIVKKTDPLKIKDGFILREVAGNYVVIGVEDESIDFNGLITINNEVGVFLWKKLESGTTMEQLLADILAEYDVDEETAKEDIVNFLKKLDEGKLLVIHE